MPVTITWYSPSWLAITVSVAIWNLGQPRGSVHRDEAGPNAWMFVIVAVSPVVGKLVPFCTTRLKVTVPENPSRAATTIEVVKGELMLIGPILAGWAMRSKTGK